MAQLGNTVIRGSLFVSGGISGSIDSALGDKDGADITVTYGASLAKTIDGNNIVTIKLLKKDGITALSAIAIDPLTLDKVLQAGSSSSRAITLSGTVSLTSVINISGVLTQSGIADFTNATDYSSSTVAAIKVAGGMYVAKKIYCNSTIQGVSVVGAVWNDIAEYREVIEDSSPGTVVKEIGNDKLIKTWNRLEPGCSIISDTYGFSMGKTEKAKTPISIAGRVLAKYCGTKDDYVIGQAVCSGPEGCVSPMTRKEIIEYPDAIIGFVSSFPGYKIWGSGEVEVGRRIWIKLR